MSHQLNICVTGLPPAVSCGRYAASPQLTKQGRIDFWDTDNLINLLYPFHPSSSITPIPSWSLCNWSFGSLVHKLWYKLFIALENKACGRLDLILQIRIYSPNISWFIINTSDERCHKAISLRNIPAQAGAWYFWINFRDLPLYKNQIKSGIWKHLCALINKCCIPY